MKNIYKTNDVSIFKNVKSDQLPLLSQNRRCIKKDKYEKYSNTNSTTKNAQILLWFGQGRNTMILPCSGL